MAYTRKSPVSRFKQLLILALATCCCCCGGETDFEMIARETGMPQFKYIDQKDSDACSISQPRSYALSVWCPLRDFCSVSTFDSGGVMLDMPQTMFRVDLTQDCKTKTGEKINPNNTDHFYQLSAVIHLLEMTIVDHTGNNSCHLSGADLLKLDLSNNGLTNAEKIGSGNCESCRSKLTHLILSSNGITNNIPDNAFCQFPSLVILELSGCNISTIHSRAFAYLKNISQINLSNNKLQHLPPDLFFHNNNYSKLRILSLLNNRLNSAVLRTTLRPLAALRYLVIDRNLVEDNDSSTIFEGHPQLTELSADDNELTRIDQQLLKPLHRLWKLSLVSNLIESIAPEAFISLTSLASINLSFNKLRKLADETLVKTHNLESLDLSCNRLEEFPLLQNLSRLRTLQMNANQLTSVKKAQLVNCTGITYVDLSKNRLDSIESGTFDDIRQLKWLDLSTNNLSSIRRVFQNANITRLLIDFNHLTTFTFDDFSPRLEHLSIQYNHIKTIDSINFEATYHLDPRPWSIHTVHLLYNRIESLEHLFLPTSVKEFDVRNNSINVISYHPSYVMLRRNYKTSLNLLKLANNRLTTICESLVQPIFANDSVDYMLSGNPIECNCENLWLKHMRSRERLGPATPAVTDLHRVKCVQSTSHFRPALQLTEPLTTLPDEEFLCSSRTDLKNGRCACDPVLTFKKHVNNYIPCDYKCPDGCACFPNVNVSVAFYHCSNANLTRVPFDDNNYKRYTSSKLYLYLDGNNLKVLGAQDFQNFSGELHHLYLNKSKIRSIEAGTFENLTSLEILHLDGNELELLPENLFAFAVNLTQLYLSHNRLSILPENLFIPLKSLLVLALHENNVRELNFGKLELQLKNLHNLTLEGNPWSCDCAFVETFRGYLLNRGSIVPHQNQINCTETANGNEFSLVYDKTLCQSTVNVTLLIALLILVTGLVSISGFVFYYRHEMEVLVYSRYGVRVFSRKRMEEEEAGNKLYDAFIAYNNDDEDFMMHKLLPGLESIDRPFRTCIHQRDFPVGAYINESILEAVKLSSRTIILLTDSFVQSGWCRFEFKTAHVQMLQDRCPRVLVVVVDDIPKNLDPEMKLYLKTNTYLKWGEKLFWKKLYFAMPDKRVTTPKTEIIPMD